MAASNPSRSYELAGGEELTAGLVRVAAGRAEQAIERLRASGGGEVDAAAAVHDARKDLKKLRTALRLLRDQLGAKRHRRLDACFRDAGRALSAGRDAEIKPATLEALAAGDGELPPQALEAWRRTLARDREAAAGAPAAERAAAAAVGRIEAGLAELRGARLGGDRWKPVGAGLERTYRRGRRAMRAARRQGGEADFHEWRKRAKDLWYELRLFAPFWPRPLGAAAEEAHALSELLGDHHDLAVLRDDLRARDLGAAETAALAAAIDRRQAELAAAALPLGRRLYAERPRDFSRRLRRYREAGRA